MTVTVVLLNQDMIYHTTLESDKTVTFGSHKKDTVQVPGFASEQITIKWKKNGIHVNAKKAYSFEKEMAPLDTMLVLDRVTRTALFLSSLTVDAGEKLTLPYQCVLRCGRASDNDIVISLPFISSHHFTLTVEGGNVRIEDTGSTNGTYLNGKKVTVSKMKSGDMISVLSAQILLENGTLCFRNIGDALVIHDLENNSEADRMHAAGQQTELHYKRSPRMQFKLPSEDIMLAAAPTKGQKYEKRKGIFASLAGQGAVMAASMLTTAASPALLAARAASLITPVTSLAGSGSAGKARKKNLEQYEASRRQKYGAYIQDQKARIEAVASEQRNIISSENPESRECINILYGLKRALWERMPSDRDFLNVRIGMGYEDLCVQVRSRGGEGFTMEDDEVRELSEQIVEETRIVDNVPARVKFAEYQTVGIIGDKRKTMHLLRNMLIALTTAHCYEDVRIAAIFSEQERAEWEALRWLPHIWDEYRQMCCLAFTPEEAHQICDVFNDLVRRRINYRPENYSGKQAPAHPYYILIFGDRAAVEHEEIMNNLFTDDPALGVSALFVYDSLYQLPPKCRFIIEMNDRPCAYDRNEANKKFMFTPDADISAGQMESFARRMAAIRLDGFSANGGLPDSVTFLEGYGVKTVEELNVYERWNRSAAYKSLGVPIGTMAGGKPFIFDIHERKFGPHGLIAGTTGSGKSETMQTWILSMAVNFHPHEVAFVIIDYKGGGMANLLEPLPHVIGKVTNISANVGRSLISLRRESERRQEIFAKYGVTHIDKYQELFRAGKAKEPLPRLIIVSDEFAELKKAEPEFMAGLIQIARVGRSLGIHLVLATQKPGGVVDDQIQSNSRFRICLKVADAADSREMIRRPDAASITQSGRAFVLIGHDEYFDQFQSYWSGAPYFGNAASDEEEFEGNQIQFVEGCGKRVRPVRQAKKKKAELDELTACIRYIADTAKQHQIEKLRGPWLPELPERLTLDQLTDAKFFDGSCWPGGQPWLSTRIGIYDAPALQQQGYQVMNFAEEGHFGIYGAPGTGKTMLMKTVIFGLCSLFTPEDVNFYILDFGGWSMSSFADLPHVGGVALDSEEEKIQKLEKLLADEIENRKRIFLNHTVSSLAAYRENVGTDLPAIIVAVDNIAAMFDAYPELESLFINIATSGSTYGIYLLYTANNTTGVRYKVLQNIRGAVAFELTDKGDYAGIVGRPNGMALSGIPGRAFYKGNPPMEFQAAIFIDGNTDKEQNTALKDRASKMNSAWKGKLPRQIPVMPSHVTAESMIREYTARNVIPVGIGCEDIQTVLIDLSDHYAMAVTGSMQCGKSAMLLRICELLRTNEDNRFYVFDGLRGSLSSLSSSAEHYALCNDDDGVNSMLADLVDQLNIRKRAQNAARQEQGDTLDEKQFIASYPQLCIIIDDLKEFVDAVSDASRNSMERICRLAQNLGVLVICAGRFSDLAKYNEIESLTRVIIANQNGIALNGTPAQYAFFQNNLKYNERDNEAGEGFGWIYLNGKCQRFRIME